MESNFKNKEKNLGKIVLIARSKLSIIENKISKALIHNKFSHEEFTTIINETNNYFNLQESIRMMKSQKRISK